jgi:hypothetical protein
MKMFIWVLTGAVSTWLCTAVASRWGTASHLAPDAAIIVLTFLAMHREPAQLVLVAGALGYLVGRQMLAPTGLSETTMVACAVTTYLAAGHLAGSGAMFFGVASGGAVVFYHLLLFLLLVTVRGAAGFTGWATVLLVPNGMVTAVVAWIFYPALMRLERILTPEKTDGLIWR